MFCTVAAGPEWTLRQTALVRVSKLPQTAKARLRPPPARVCLVRVAGLVAAEAAHKGLPSVLELRCAPQGLFETLQW